MRIGSVTGYTAGRGVQRSSSAVRQSAVSSLSGSNTAAERLSSGMRASDRLKSVYSRYITGNTNAAMQKSLGAMDEMQDRLEKLKSLADQASDMVSAADRRNLQKEADALASEISRIAGEANLTSPTALLSAYSAKTSGDAPSNITPLSEATLIPTTRASVTSDAMLSAYSAPSPQDTPVMAQTTPIATLSLEAAPVATQSSEAAPMMAQAAPVATQSLEAAPMMAQTTPVTTFALQKSAPVAQANTTESISAVTSQMSHAWTDDISAATWSAVVDPSEIKAGNVMTINGVKFTFKNDVNNAASNIGIDVTVNGSDTTKTIDLTTATDKLKAFANNFCNLLNTDSSIRSAFETYWKGKNSYWDPATTNPSTNTTIENPGKLVESHDGYSPYSGTPPMATWEQNKSGNWVLSLKQPNAWVAEGLNSPNNSSGQWTIDTDAFDVSAEIAMSEAGNLTINQRGNFYITESGNISVSTVTNGGLTFQIDDAQIVTKFVGDNADLSVLPDNVVEWDEDQKNATIYVYADAAEMLDGNARAGTLQFALNQVLSDKGTPGKPLGTAQVFQSGSSSFSFRIQWDRDKIDTTSGTIKGPEFDVTQPSIEFKGIEADKSAARTPAYLLYEIDTSKLETGDSFTFRDVCFVFNRDSTTNPTMDIPDTTNKIVYVNIRNSDTSLTGDSLSAVMSQWMNDFKASFNNYFQVKDTSTVASSAGAQSGGSSKAPKSNGFKTYDNLYELIRSGAFEMKVMMNGTKATIAILAKTKNVLNDDMEIGMDDDEGWGNVEDAAAQTQDDAVEVQAVPYAMSYAGEAAVPAAPVENTVNLASPQSAKAVSYAVSVASEELDAQRKQVAADSLTRNGSAAVGSIDSADEAQEAVAETKAQMVRTAAESMDAQSNELDSKKVEQLISASVTGR